MGSSERDALLKQAESAAPLIAGIAHDLSNPLAGILGYCHLLQRQTDPEKIRGYAARIQSQAVVCRDLLDRLKDAMTPPEGAPRPVAADELVRGACAMQAETLRSQSVTLVIDVPEDTPKVLADKELFRRALSRLLDNALDATEQQTDRRVTIRVSTDDRHVRYDVIDNGPGFTEETAAQAFDPKYTTRRSGRGLGLGLLTALRLMRQMDGDVEILESEDGARVRLRLPRGDQPRSTRMRVLCVDDEPFIHELYEDIFSDMPVQLWTAIDGEGAIALLADRTFDLVICDFLLPQGFRAPDIYAAMDERHAKTRFAVCTGNAHSDVIEEFAAATGCPILTKPFSVDALKSLLDVPEPQAR